MHDTQPCLVTKWMSQYRELHHVRKLAGDQKDDTRVVMLTGVFHRVDPNAVEKIGDRRFQDLFGLDFEADIKRCNEAYVAQGGKL